MKGLLSYKAEFESEGTRYHELKELQSIAKDVPVSVKIGGCEAIRDLYDCQDLGITTVVAPMIETSYAASKFVGALKKVYNVEPKSYINIETHTAYKNIDTILDVITPDLNGIVFGRVDYVSSLGMSRESVNDSAILTVVKDVKKRCDDYGLDFILGGAVSFDSIPFLQEVGSKFETRKCIFDPSSANVSTLIEAIRFELRWLKTIQSDDRMRIMMLEKRLNKSLATKHANISNQELEDR